MLFRSRDAETDGYYRVVTSEGGRTAEEMVGTCRNLRGIEESLLAVLSIPADNVPTSNS